MDSSSLEKAYAAFLEMAGSGPFTAPANPQKWTAELNVAHMVVIDHLLAATISELLAGRTPNHDNRPSIRDAHLREIVAAAGDLPTLIALARQSSAVVCALVREVDAETAERPFPILLQSGEKVVVDTTWSLATLVGAQAQLHLPGHTRAIEALKA
ncbi:MAG TPA: hypothetical protein VNT75_03750 [Symbiobacteriaceae bacterium]|nr:hypothetical protein [Symbiobacteriaceae bacterium]